MRKLLGVLALTIAVAVTGACGNKSKETAQQIVAGASDKTVATTTAKLAETISFTGGGQSPPGVTGSGVIAFPDRRASLDLDISGTKATVLLVGTTIYERIPSLESRLGDKPWLKIDLNDFGKLAGIQGLGDLATSNNDPSASLDSLRGAGSVEFLGYQKVRGVDTKRYHAVIDLEAAATKAPPAQQATLRQIIKLQGFTTQPADVWVDKQGRVRRLTESVDMTHATLPAPGATLPKTIEISVEYFDFGTPVRVDAPAPNQTTDLAAMLTKLTRSHGSGTVTPAARSLEARLISAVPAGYLRQPDSVGDTGPSDLEKAVRDDDSPDARQVLTRDGFLGGYQRLWKKGANELTNFVYQFSSPAGATDYVSRSIAEMRKDGSEFPVAGIPGAKGFRHTGAEGTSVGVTFTRGGYATLVLVNGTDATPAFVTSLAQQQYAKLA